MRRLAVRVFWHLLWLMRVEPHGPGDAVLSGSAAAAQAKTFLLGSTPECGPRTASFEIHQKKACLINFGLITALRGSNLVF
jgi:hypothetical protein